MADPVVAPTLVEGSTGNEPVTAPPVVPAATTDAPPEQSGEGKWRLDLSAANRDLLITAGLPAESIQV